MANREENLKKINDELEQLSDEELEHVTGGTGFIPTPEADGTTTGKTLELTLPDNVKLQFLFK